ncbi:MAG: AraC family transcriptional regulator [Moheibacter sp.]
MYYNFLNILLLIGAVQGLLFTVIISSSKKFKSKSNLFLGLLILGFSLNNLQYYFLMADLISHKTFFNLIYLPYASVNMVFYYFYVKTFLYPNSKITPKEKLLFTPFLFFFTLVIVYKGVNAFGTMSDGFERFFFDLLFFHEVFSLIFSLGLLYITFKIISDYQKELRIGNSGQINRNLSWLIILSYIGFGLCLLWLLALVVELWGTSDSNLFYYTLWIGMSFTIYILGHIGLYKFGILEEQKEIKSKRMKSAVKVERIKAFKTGNDNLDKFRNFIMVEKNYLNSNLSLDVVADHLKLNKSYLSRIINSELSENFTDYVNRLRVEEAKKYLEDSDYSNYTLHAIGLEVGFNSKSAFNSAFKKFTSQTPNEYKKKNLTEPETF